MSCKLDAARCRIAEGYVKRWQPSQCAALADAQDVILLLLAEARMQLADAMKVRASLPPEEINKHAFASIVSWIGKIAEAHRHDSALLVWLTQQIAAEPDDGIATLLLTVSNHLAEVKY